MVFNFANKVVLVSGASSGIGEATALLFAKYGARLALVGRDEGRLQGVVARCEKEQGVKPLAIIADLATDQGCEKTASETLKHCGKLDVLVNNAGVGALATIQTTDMAVFDRVFNLDVRGVYNLTRLLAPSLIKSKGNIVNISSIAGTVVAVGSLPYGMAKAALNHFTQLVALELASKGVRVNSVSPSLTKTRFMDRIADISAEDFDKFLEDASKGTPMGRFGTADEIAKMVVMFASEYSEIVTGVLMTVDGAASHTIGATMPHAHFKRK